MINKKLKTLIATLMITSLSNNVAFAEIMNLRNPDTQENANPETSQKIDIVKDQITDTHVSFSRFSSQPFSTGNANNGSKGVTVSAAYLTPANEFGYIYIDKYDYGGRGTVVAAIDELNPDSMWGGDVNSGTLNSNNRLYEHAKDYFVNSSGKIIKSIQDIEDTKIDSYNIQTANDGRTFVAATFYVRYSYDFLDNHNLTGYKYLKSYPVLGNTSAYTGGPYIAMGDYFDDSIDVIDLGNTGRNDIASRYGKYFLPLSDLVSSNTNLNRLGLTYDYHPLKAVNNNYVTTSTNKAMLEKRFEYRRYVETEEIVTDNPAGFEFVYGVTNSTIKNQTVIPDISPKLSITSNTEYTDNSRGSISRYAFDVTIHTRDKERGNTYENDFQPYTIRRISDKPDNEPKENQMDLWHSNLTATFDIVDPSGNSRLYSPKSIPTYGSTVYVYPDDIKPNDNGSKSLDDCTAKVTLNFKNNARFMSHKEVYSYHYNQNGEVKTYDDVIDYISEKPTGLQLRTDIENYQTSTDPREELIYKTETSRTRTVEATTGILSITAGDYAHATVTVGVTPPNALTVLEGGEFDVNININTNGVPIGNNGTDTWISDFRIDELLITSASGDVIYRENNISINPTTATTINKQVNHLTAKPTHIGKAIVKVTYSYIINKQTYRRVPIEESGRLDSNGDMIWDYTTIREPLEQVPQSGSAQNNFKIYSLSGNTVS